MAKRIKVIREGQPAAAGAPSGNPVRSARAKAKAVLDDLEWSGKPNHIEIIYELPEASELSVFELAPALTSLGVLIRDAHRALNPDGPDLAINVRPFQPGSFDVPTVISYAPALATSLFPVSIPVTAQQIFETLKALGLIATGINSVLAVIKLLKGRPRKIERRRGGFKATRGDRSTNVGRDVGTLIQNNNVYTNIYNVFGAPIEHGASRSVRTYVKGNPASEARVDTSSVSALKEAAVAGDITNLDEKTATRTIHASLHPKRGAFDRDGHQWSFKWGEQVIVAEIKDKAFLAKYDAGEVRLNGHDTLNVTMVERQRVVGNVIQSTSYEIISVDAVLPGMQQQKLIE